MAKNDTPRSITIRNHTTNPLFMPIKGIEKQVVYEWQQLSPDSPALSKVPIEREFECVVRHIDIPGSHYQKLFSAPASVTVSAEEFAALSEDGLFRAMLDSNKLSIQG